MEVMHNLEITNRSLKKTLCENPEDKMIGAFRQCTLDIDAGFMRYLKAGYTELQVLDEKDNWRDAELYSLGFRLKDGSFWVYSIQTQKEKNDIHRIGYVQRRHSVVTVLESIAYGPDVNIGMDKKELKRVDSDCKQEMTDIMNKWLLKNTQYLKTELNIDNNRQKKLSSFLDSPNL